MVVETISRKGRAAFFLTILTLAIFGCASTGNKKQPSTVEEVAYIDLKQGFSLVIPTTWKRERIPVSSPNRNPDSVTWQMTRVEEPKDILQISSIAAALPLKGYLSNLNNGRFTLTEQMPASVPHPAGPALRWEGEDNLEKVVLLSIEGSKRRYFIICRMAAVNYSRLMPTIEKVIASFSILDN